MIKSEVIVKIKHGLHARPASQFIQKASKFKSDIQIHIDEKSFNAKSILALISAGIRYDSKITISADGEDEKEAVEDLTNFIENLHE